MKLYLKNPHSILAAIQTRPHDLLEVFIPAKESQGPWAQIRAECSQKKIKIGSSVFKPEKNALEASGRTSPFGAWIKPKASCVLEKLFAKKGENGSLFLALDCLQDPQNVGALFRSAAFFGVRGILMTAERSAPLSATVYDIASGGVETVPFATEINLRRALDIAKKSGLWILGTSEHSKESYHSIRPDRPWLVVLGNEEKGMRRLTEDSCDLKCGILPADGASVTSLNVSVAGGVLMAHLRDTGG